MELCSFWVINPADGQGGKPEPIKLTFFENGDINLVSLSQDEEYRGAYRLPSGSYSYKGDALMVSEDQLNRIVSLVSRTSDEDEFRSSLNAAQLINDREWNMFYANPSAWKNLRLVVISFGDE